MGGWETAELVVWWWWGVGISESPTGWSRAVECWIEGGEEMLAFFQSDSHILNSWLRSLGGKFMNTALVSSQLPVKALRCFRS